MPLYLVPTIEHVYNAICLSDSILEGDKSKLPKNKSLLDVLKRTWNILDSEKPQAYYLEYKTLSSFQSSAEVGYTELLEDLYKFVMHKDIHLYLIISNTLEGFDTLEEVKGLEKYINYFQNRNQTLRSPRMHFEEASALHHYKENLKEIELEKSETFVEMLFRLIDAKKKTDVEVYKKANIDRKLFSKIRSDIDYSPSKRTAVAFAIALELNLDKTQDLLNCAGYQLSTSKTFDLIIRYCIKHKMYDIYKINEYLYYYDQPILG